LSFLEEEIFIKILLIFERHAKNDESETSTTWSTSTGFGGTSNR